MKWYAIACTLLVSFSGFMWGYDIGAMNGVKEMPGYRAALNISYTLLLAEDNDTGQCTSSDDVETSALLGIVVTILHIGCLIGALIAGILSDVAGRKVAIITGTVSCIVGVTLHAGAINIWMALIGRLSDGLGIGILYQVSPLYIAELSPKELRGRLISFIAIASVFGTLVGNILNVFTEKYWFGWRITLAAQLVAAGVVAIGTIFVPETPRWLVKKGRYKKALDVLKRIHQDDSKAVRDLEEIKASINTATKIKMSDTIKFLFRWDILQRLSTGFFLQFFGRFNGGVFIVYYSVTLFCHVGVNGFVASIALLLCMCIAQVAGMTIVDKAGRKRILLVSGLFLSVFALSIATTIVLFDLDDPPEEGFYQEQTMAGYLIVILVTLFMCTFVVSYANIPFIVNSEIFPLQVRSITVGITTMGWWGGTIVLNELSAVMLSSPLGSYGTFYFIAGSCILMNIYVLLFIPETKRKSLEEIECLFKKPWYKRVNFKSYIWCWLISCGCQKYHTRYEEIAELQASFSSRTDSSESVHSSTCNSSEHSRSIDSETSL